MNDINQTQLHSPSLDQRERANAVSAGNIRYSDLFWLFFFGSVIGFLLEGIWNLVMRGEWANHSATVWGPFCIIYGLGSVVMYLLAAPLQGRAIGLQFLLYAVMGALLEFEASLFQELCFGSTSWDYSAQWLNIGGRISLPMTLIWGILGLGFSLFVFPVLQFLLERTHGTPWQLACGVLSVVMACNLLLTSAAVRRWHDRMDGTPPMNEWEVYLDRKYDNVTMSEIFSNMVFESTE